MGWQFRLLVVDELLRTSHEGEARKILGAQTPPTEPRFLARWKRLEAELLPSSQAAKAASLFAEGANFARVAGDIPFLSANEAEGSQKLPNFDEAEAVAVRLWPIPSAPKIPTTSPWPSHAGLQRMRFSNFDAAFHT